MIHRCHPTTVYTRQVNEPDIGPSAANRQRLQVYKRYRSNYFVVGSRPQQAVNIYSPTMNCTVQYYTSIYHMKVECSGDDETLN